MYTSFARETLDEMYESGYEQGIKETEQALRVPKGVRNSLDVLLSSASSQILFKRETVLQACKWLKSLPTEEER